jgi:hypothetical protein
VRGGHAQQLVADAGRAVDQARQVHARAELQRRHTAPAEHVRGDRARHGARRACPVRPPAGLRAGQQGLGDPEVAVTQALSQAEAAGQAGVDGRLQVTPEPRGVRAGLAAQPGGAREPDAGRAVAPAEGEAGGVPGQRAQVRPVPRLLVVLRLLPGGGGADRRAALAGQTGRRDGGELAERVRDAGRAVREAEQRAAVQRVPARPHRAVDGGVEDAPRVGLRALQRGGTDGTVGGGGDPGEHEEHAGRAGEQVEAGAGGADEVQRLHQPGARGRRARSPSGQQVGDVQVAGQPVERAGPGRGGRRVAGLPLVAQPPQQPVHVGADLGRVAQRLEEQQHAQAAEVEGVVRRDDLPLVAGVHPEGQPGHLVAVVAGQARDPGADRGGGVDQGLPVGGAGATRAAHPPPVAAGPVELRGPQGGGRHPVQGRALGRQPGRAGAHLVQRRPGEEARQHAAVAGQQVPAVHVHLEGRDVAAQQRLPLRGEDGPPGAVVRVHRRLHQRLERAFGEERVVQHRGVAQELGDLRVPGGVADEHPGPCGRPADERAQVGRQLRRDGGERRQQLAGRADELLGVLERVDGVPGPVEREARRVRLRQPPADRVHVPAAGSVPGDHLGAQLARPVPVRGQVRGVLVVDPDGERQDAGRGRRLEDDPGHRVGVADLGVPGHRGEQGLHVDQVGLVGPGDDVLRVQVGRAQQPREGVELAEPAVVAAGGGRVGAGERLDPGHPAVVPAVEHVGHEDLDRHAVPGPQRLGQAAQHGRRADRPRLVRDPALLEGHPGHGPAAAVGVAEAGRHLDEGQLARVEHRRHAGPVLAQAAAELDAGVPPALHQGAEQAGEQRVAAEERRAGGGRAADRREVGVEPVPLGGRGERAGGLHVHHERTGEQPERRQRRRPQPARARPAGERRGGAQLVGGLPAGVVQKRSDDAEQRPLPVGQRQVGRLHRCRAPLAQGAREPASGPRRGVVLRDDPGVQGTGQVGDRPVGQRQRQLTRAVEPGPDRGLEQVGRAPVEWCGGPGG